MTDRLALGAYGERLAARYLREHGMTVIDRNWRCDQGEIDLVARDGRVLVVCEVKTRRSEAFGAPAQAVGREKALRLRRLAGCWIDAHPRTGTNELRIDIVAILRPLDGPAILTHLRGVA